MIGGHGWVYPREDGAKARCGGPSICPRCAREVVIKDSSDAAKKALEIAAIGRASNVALLRATAEELKEWAEEKRQPLPQGNQDIDAREAIDQQAIGLDDAATFLEDKADELEGKPRRGSGT